MAVAVVGVAIVLLLLLSGADGATGCASVKSSNSRDGIALLDDGKDKVGSDVGVGVSVGTGDAVGLVAIGAFMHTGSAILLAMLYMDNSKDSATSVCTRIE